MCYQRGQNRKSSKHGSVVPTLFVLGCQKCATSSLHYQLVNSLPFVKSSGLKENFFFCDKDLLEQGCEFYIEQGQWRNNPVCGPRSKGNIHNKVVGLDSTPNYLSFCPLAPARLAKFFSNTHKKLIRFVVILRHPTVQTAHPTRTYPGP